MTTNRRSAEDRTLPIRGNRSTRAGVSHTRPSHVDWYPDCESRFFCSLEPWPEEMGFEGRANPEIAAAQCRRRARTTPTPVLYIRRLSRSPQRRPAEDVADRCSGSAERECGARRHQVGIVRTARPSTSVKTVSPLLLHVQTCGGEWCAV